MRWPFGRGAADTPSSRPAAAAAAPTPAPSPPTSAGDWRDIAPVQRALAEPVHPVAINDGFRASLASFTDPSFLAPLSHQVEPSSGGLVEGLAAPSEHTVHQTSQDLVVRHRAPEPAGRSTALVQRSFAGASAQLPTVRWELPDLVSSAAPSPDPEPVRTAGMQAVAEAPGPASHSSSTDSMSTPVQRAVVTPSAQQPAPPPTVDVEPIGSHAITHTAEAAESNASAESPAPPSGATDLPVVSRSVAVPVEAPNAPVQVPYRTLPATSASVDALPALPVAQRQASTAAPTQLSAPTAPGGSSLVHEGGPSAPSALPTPSPLTAPSLLTAPAELPVVSRFVGEVGARVVSPAIPATSAPALPAAQLGENQLPETQLAETQLPAAELLAPGLLESRPALDAELTAAGPAAGSDAPHSVPTLTQRLAASPLVAGAESVAPTSAEPAVQRLEYAASPAPGPHRSLQRSAAADPGRTPSHVTTSEPPSSSVAAPVPWHADLGATAQRAVVTAQRLASGVQGAAASVQGAAASVQRSVTARWPVQRGSVGQAQPPAAPVQRRAVPTAEAEVASGDHRQDAPPGPVVQRFAPQQVSVASEDADDHAPVGPATVLDEPTGPAVPTEPWTAPPSTESGLVLPSGPPVGSGASAARPTVAIGPSLPIQRSVSAVGNSPQLAPQAAAQSRRPAAPEMSSGLGAAMSFASMFAGVASDSGSPAEDGFTSVQLAPAESAPPEPAPAPAVQRAPEAAAPAGGGAPGAPGAPGADLDELARRLYEPLAARLRAELWLDRERAGALG